MARPSNILFSNLRAEMARREITIKGVADILGVNRDTASNKLSGKSPLYLDEAFKIERGLFPGAGVRYLFSELEANENRLDAD